MKAMVLAAGLGTRLRPWTLEHPKALVPVEGIPMLYRVIDNLRSQGFDSVVVNVHHFSDQMIDYINSTEFGIRVYISDETDYLLDTGGGILKASSFFGDESALIHNVDILSSASLNMLYESHIENGDDITMLVSNRESSRKLIFNSDMILEGWHNVKTDQYRIIGDHLSNDAFEVAFSGIYVMSPKSVLALREYMKMIGKESFPIMDFFLSGFGGLKIRGVLDDDLHVLDIGQPSSLESASKFIKTYLDAPC